MYFNIFTLILAKYMIYDNFSPDYLTLIFYNAIIIVGSLTNSFDSMPTLTWQEIYMSN